MTPSDLRAKLQEKPFQPFRIVMDSGQALEVRHPEFVQVTVSAAYVFPLPTRGDISPGPPTVCSIRNISTLEPLPEKAA
jgi:hypothetical protein